MWFCSPGNESENNKACDFLVPLLKWTRKSQPAPKHCIFKPKAHPTPKHVILWSVGLWFSGPKKWLPKMAFTSGTEKCLFRGIVARAVGRQPGSCCKVFCFVTYQPTPKTNSESLDIGKTNCMLLPLVLLCAKERCTQDKKSQIWSDLLLPHDEI